VLFFSANSQENYRDWRYYRAITLNTTSTGASVSGNATNFPVLIRLNASNFNFSQAKNDGSDIRFSKAGGAPLTYEIERWDRANQVAEIWVRLDMVYGGNSGQSIIMYWGNPIAVARSDGTAVFRTSDNFQAVWHLGEDGNTSAGGYKNAASNALHGTGYNLNASSDVDGMIGKAQEFDGSSSYIDIAGSASGLLNFPEDGNYTVSVWVYSDVLNGLFHPVIGKGDKHGSSLSTRIASAGRRLSLRQLPAPGPI
jgi:hypothetical protein